MMICKKKGYPDLFVTFTCNPKWPELVELLNSKNAKAEDKPDLLKRIFKIKLDQLMKDFIVMVSLENQMLSTTLDEDGYPIHRIRDNDISVEKGVTVLDNRNKDLKMPIPSDPELYSHNNRLIYEELNYDKTTLAKELENLISSITEEQKTNTMIGAVNSDKGGFYFVHGFGVASSGIPSLLIPGEVYLSADSVSKSEFNIDGVEGLYTTDMLNSIKGSGLSNHELRLKVGTPVML
ncbi:putative PIF1 DNA helicase/replication protein A1-like protein [Senna tora]|uniref:Putative PIF1 DNA helicase/replication protein A1-like protein n=1 Tax=Senna tora TaxID=362788 RepID=A0A834SQX7_9FABA|nr:putative PIF1 DNA helicase/replication protein A1-like protein [Senna tora]